MGRIECFREKFEDIIEEVLEQDLSMIDAKELGEVVDCLKDICQAEYYCSVITAMETNEDDISSEVRNRMYYHNPEVETEDEVIEIINKIADTMDINEKTQMKQRMITEINRL